MTQDEIDELWRAELSRRIDDIESGTVDLLDVGESHAQLRAELAARRSKAGLNGLRRRVSWRCERPSGTAAGSGRSS